jgi:hypothetical protein
MLRNTIQRISNPIKRTFTTVPPSQQSTKPRSLLWLTGGLVTGGVVGVHVPETPVGKKVRSYMVQYTSFCKEDVKPSANVQKEMTESEKVTQSVV